MSQPPQAVSITGIFLQWSFEQRLRYFAMGAGLPMLLVISPVYFMLRSPNTLVIALFALFALGCLTSSVGLAICCVSPATGIRKWITPTITLGMLLWLPIALCVCILTSMMALIPAVIMAGMVTAAAKVIAQLYPSGTRFSIRQIFLLTTIAALFFAVLSAILQSSERVQIVVTVSLIAVIASVPIVAFGTFAIVLNEVLDARRVADDSSRS